MRASRPTNNDTAVQVNLPSEAMAVIAPSTTNLSARGSKNAPDELLPRRRATHPSAKSENASAAHRSSAAHDGLSRSTTTTRTGVARMRATVTPFAMLTSPTASATSRCTVAILARPGPGAVSVWLCRSADVTALSPGKLGLGEEVPPVPAQLPGDRPPATLLPLLAHLPGPPLSPAHKSR